MKESFTQFSLDYIEIHALDFEADIDSGSDDTTASDQDLSLGPDSKLQPDFESNQYQLPLLLSDILAPHCLFLFHCTYTRALTEMGKMKDKIYVATEQPGLE